MTQRAGSNFIVHGGVEAYSLHLPRRASEFSRLAVKSYRGAHCIFRDAHHGGFGAARRCLRQLALTAVLLAPAAVLLAPAAARAQSTDLLLAYKNFEAAKAADKVSDALKYGNTALKLTEEAGDKPGLVELLRNLGEYSAQVNQDGVAAEFVFDEIDLRLAALIAPDQSWSNHISQIVEQG